MLKVSGLFWNVSGAMKKTRPWGTCMGSAFWAWMEERGQGRH